MSNCVKCGGIIKKENAKSFSGYVDICKNCGSITGFELIDNYQISL